MENHNLNKAQKAKIQEYGEPLIEYIQQTETNYATSRYINKKTSIKATNSEIGTAMSAFNQIYNENFNWSTEDSTRNQWMIYRLQQKNLEKLADQILEP